MIKALFAAVLLFPTAALACMCEPRWVAKCTSAQATLDAELERGSYHDDPTDVVALEAEVIDLAPRTVHEVNGSQKSKRDTTVMRLLIRSKSYDAYSKAPLAGGVVEVAAGNGLSCDAGVAGFQPGARYKFVLRPSPYVAGMYRLPACGVYAEEIK